MTWMALLLTLTGVSFADKLDKEFACYTQMNSATRTENLIMDSKVAIHPIDGTSFYVVTAKSVGKCTVPRKASPLDPGDPNGPKLVNITYDQVPYHIQYPKAEEHTALAGSPPWLKAKCGSVSNGKEIAALLKNRIFDSRQACVQGPQFADCLAEFLERLKSCQGIAAVSVDVEEIGRSAQAHARPPAVQGGGGPPAVGR